MKNKKRKLVCVATLVLTLLAAGCGVKLSSEEMGISMASERTLAQLDVEEYSGQPFTVVNDNVPDFSESDMDTDSYERYSKLDSKGRCGEAMANIGEDLMPTGKRGAIGKIKPSGWQTVKYDCVDGKYLYNRCHLIGYQLTAENANKKNLITGTRYLNVEGMLPFENMVADYVHETGNHVLYRVTPIFEGENLVASGVQMEAKSVEDDGEGILFNVYCYNVQPGVVIDYETGKSEYVGGEECYEDTANVSAISGAHISTENGNQDLTDDQEQGAETTYVLNTNTKKFHKPECSSISRMKDSNKETRKMSREELISQGYDPCKRCNP